MSSPSKSSVLGTLRFGVYEADLRCGELRKYGLKIPIEEKPFQALVILLQQAGELVTREQLRVQLWPADVFIDFDHSLNTVVAKARRALNDSAQEPRFIETVGRRGYRFIAVVESLSQDDVSAPDPAPLVQPRTVQPTTAVPVSSVPEGQIRRPLRMAGLLLAGSALMVAASVAVYRAVRPAADQPFSTQQMRIRQVTEHGHVSYAGISPDGRYMVYVRRGGNGGSSLWAQQVATGSDLAVVSPRDGKFLDTISFSPDGNHVYFGHSAKENASRFDLYTVPILGGPIVRVISDVAGAAISPDGNRIAFVRLEPANGRTLLMVAGIDGSDIKKLAERSSKEPFLRETPAWSPRGKLVAAVAAHNGNEASREIVVAPVAGGEPTVLRSRRAFGQFAWLNDQGLLAVAFDFSAGFAPGSDRAQLYYQPFPSGDAIRFSNDMNHYTTVGLAAAGDALVSVKQDVASNLFVAPASGFDAARQITHEKIGALDLDWISHDRLVVQDASMHLFLIDADGTNRTMLFDQFAAHAPQRCGQDAIVFNRVDPDNVIGLWALDLRGGAPRQLSSGGLDTRASCSPDGQWVYYTCFDCVPVGLMKIPFAGGQAVPVGPPASSKPLVSADGAEVLFQTSEGQGSARREFVAVMRTSDGSVMGEWPVPEGTYTYLIRWGPDARSFAYTRRIDDEWTLWQQPLSGGAARRIASVSDFIWGFAYSPDGKRLALSHGADARDVVLFTNFRK